MPASAAALPAAASVTGRSFTAYGTFGSLLVTDPSALAAAHQVLSVELHAIDMACSRFRDDSELAALNRAAGREVAISPLFAQALAVALTAAEITDGDVDPTCGASLANLGYDRDFAAVPADTPAPPRPPVPAAGWSCVRLDRARLTARLPAGVQLDLGATAKALCADLAATAISARTCCGVLVNLGGDLAVAGPAPEGGWRVEISHDPPGRAQDRRALRAAGPVVAITGGGLATSSTSSRRWRRSGRPLHHILRPGTGEPAVSCWESVSVAAASCVEANTASTAAIIRGDGAVGWLDGFGLPARLTRSDGTVVVTGGWPE